MANTVFERIQGVREAVLRSCEKAGRNPNEIQIVAISKGLEPSFIQDAVNAGITHFGENFIQEALPKQETLRHLPITWHFTGHLQRNKAKTAALHFELIHSVDSLQLAEKLHQIGLILEKQIPLLFELKTHLQSAYGFTPLELQKQAPYLNTLSRLKPLGLMTMAPASGNPEQKRKTFQTAREVLSSLKLIFSPEFKELSMGMSEDFMIAVEEGATVIRVGRAIFGERRKKPLFNQREGS